MGKHGGDALGRYLYERLGDKRFQQLCAALVKLDDPTITCYPVGQSDGGRDMANLRNVGLIYQVKWAKHQPRNPVTWLDAAIAGEADSIRALVRAGAREYVLMTSVEGTAVPGRGTIDQLDRRLALHSKTFGIDMRCEWRDDIDRRVEAAPVELTWTYQEMLAGTDAVRYVIEAEGTAEHEQELRALLIEVMKTQWQDDTKVKFKQVELESRDLMDLFVDVEATRVALPARVANHPRSNRGSGTSLGGAAAHLLSTDSPLTVVRGAPGQGKSTLGQYLCQVHRAEFVADDAYRAGATPLVRPGTPRLPIRVELRDYATWLSSGDPFTDADEPRSTRRPKPRKQASLEQFLAELLQAKSGGLSATVGTVQDVLHRFPILIVLDGLDEVAQSRVRERVVKEIDEFSARLGSSLSTPQIVVTTRPNASGMAEPNADTFDTIALSRLSPELRIVYLRKWADAHEIRGKDRRDLERTFRQRSAEPHIDALADNPMQLTILLYLIKKRGSSVPSSRTALYRSYMETLLDREAAKTPAVDEFRDDLEEVTAYLGWHLQSRAENTGDEGRLPVKALRAALNSYLFEVDKDVTLVDALFVGVTDRVWALSSRVQGTFEFDVQPLREYFAARFLNEFAGADLPAFDKSMVLRHLVRRAYWLNTARFFAGFANTNELAGLVEGLADERDETSMPAQARIGAWTLVADGVFGSRARTKRSAAELFGDDLSVRLLSLLSSSDPEFAVPAPDRGGQEIVDLLQQQLAEQPESPIALERVAVILKLQERQDFDAWWKPMLLAAADQPTQQAWLRIGSPVHAASRLSPTDIEKLDLSTEESLPCAVDAGVVPPPHSGLEQRMVRTVLAGHCSDMRGAPTGMPGDLLTILSPQHLYRKATGQIQAYAIDVGHVSLPASDHQKQAAIKRLITRDVRFENIQRSLRFNRGQSGTTSPWGNTALALSAIYGPCWLAAEIAITGAALPRDKFRTSGDSNKGSVPLGADTDYACLLEQVRLNRSRADWWSAQFDDHPDALSRATWALALLTVATPGVVITQLGKLGAVVQQLPQPMLKALLSSSSRLGTSGQARRLPGDAMKIAPDPHSPEVALLVTHHVSPVGPDSILDQYSDQQLCDLSQYGISTWPALLTLTMRMLSQPSESLLAAIGQFKFSPVPPHVKMVSGLDEYARKILARPAEYPLQWVLAAEQLISFSAEDPSLATVARKARWFSL